MTRTRLRDLGITIGKMPTGHYNAITDVPGVWVGHRTIIRDSPSQIRTGVTVIAPREGTIWNDSAFAGVHILNGNGEATGLVWLEESGLLCSPIALTNTYYVGVARDALAFYARNKGYADNAMLPVVLETSDDWLSDVDSFRLQSDDVVQALESASGGKVLEGNVGGGTSGICHDFKGGIGTSSRLVEHVTASYTVGVLVQTNHGDRQLLRVAGVPVGEEINYQRVPSAWDNPPRGGSVIAIVGTDAPLIPTQCKSLAQRAVIGLARAGCVGHNGSGDIILAFSTGNHIPVKAQTPLKIDMLSNEELDPLFDAVAEATEEAVINSLTAAETMAGFQGRIAHALPLIDLKEIMLKYNYFVK